jgi:hypothetical protein
MTVEEFDIALTDLETRIDRLRALYENWFRGYEKAEPNVPRKDAERRVYALRKELPRNTALRFRYHQMYLKFTTLTNYWQRTSRQIEEGTYKPQLQRLKRKLEREQELIERKERRKLERPDEKKEDAQRGFELDLDESLNVDDLLDELELDEVAKAIDRPGPHSEPPPPTTVHQRLPPAGPATATATFARAKEGAAKAPAPQPGTDAARGPFVPNAQFQPNAGFQPNTGGVVANGPAKPPFQPNAPFAAAGKTGQFAAPNTASGTTLGRPAPIAAPPSNGAAQLPRPGMPPPPAPQSSAAKPVPAVPGAGAPRPFAPNAPGALAGTPANPSANGAGARPPGAQPSPPASAVAPTRPATTTVGRPAPITPGATGAGAPTSPLASSAQRPAPAAPVANGAQRPVPGAQTGGTYVGRPPVASPLAGGGATPSEQRLRHIYDEYAAARRRNNEGEVRYETLVSSIQKMLPELTKKHQGKQIDFDVVVKDGRVGLKPKAT